MKTKYFKVIVVGLVIIVGILVIWWSKAGRSISCNEINQQTPELTFEGAYCNGSFCGSVCDSQGTNCHQPSKEECEAIDVLASQDSFEFGKDGIADCRWNEKNPYVFPCQIVR